MAADTFFSERFAPEDILARVDRRRPYQGMPTGPTGIALYVLAIFLSVGILVPVYLAVILPVAAVYLGVLAAVRHATYRPEPSSKQDGADAAGAQQLPAADLSPAAVPAIDSREFDVVVFGVTGLCGKVTAEYLVYRHASKLRLAFAGRSASKLQAARAELAQRTGVEAANEIPLIECDSDDLESLLAMSRRTKVVATSVGPYNKYGEKLVRACAYSGTGYCDLTGEQDFVSEMARKYDSVAKATGARIVHLTGFDSIPSEIMATLVSEAFKAKYGEAPTRVENIVVNMGGAAPGGTIDTVVTSLGKFTRPKAARPKSRAGDDAATERPAPKGETRVSPLLPAYLSSVKAWCAPWFMGPVNSKTVQRSNALVGFAPHLQYIELQKYPTILAFLAGIIPAGVGLTLFALAPVQKLCFSTGILPKPGEGAMTRDQMAKGFFKMTSTASDFLHGNTVTMTLAGVGDPGCILTAIFMGESAALLAENFSQTTLKGAGLTPVAVLGADRLRARLQESGRVAFF